MIRDISLLIKATTSVWNSARVLFSLFSEVVGDCGLNSWSSSFSSIRRNLEYLDVAIFREDLLRLLEFVSGLSEVSESLGGRPFLGLDECLITC